MTQPFPRTPAAEVDDLFLTRWSPRAFSDRKVPQDVIASVFEAARWAPSCYNEQPWLFVYADGGKELERFRSLLVDANRRWADKAPLLGFVLARKRFKRNDKPNDWAVFDCGSAFMSMVLQAHRLGVSAHGMAGIKKDVVYEALSVPRDLYEVVCGFALGYRGDPGALPDNLREKEAPSQRKSPEDVAVRGAVPDRLRDS